MAAGVAKACRNASQDAPSRAKTYQALQAGPIHAISRADTFYLFLDTICHEVHPFLAQGSP
ncbi:MAG: hypothetical protein Rhims3KO_07140 [Hyphomicrobiales bacterium]